MSDADRAEFRGRTALVTGAGSGIGAAIAHLLAERGATVAVADIVAAHAHAVADAISAAGGMASAFPLDVTDDDACRDVVAGILARFGSLHLAVNNAGISGPITDIPDVAVSAWRKVMSVNLDGVFHGLRHQIPAMAAQGGSIVNVASMYGLTGRAQMSAYVSAKHGVIGLTRVAALENAKAGIRVNAVCPGVVETPLLTENTDAEARAALTALHPIGRFANVQEVAETVLFLLSDRAAFTTGACYAIDGGVTAQ